MQQGGQKKAVDQQAPRANDNQPMSPNGQAPVPTREDRVSKFSMLDTDSGDPSTSMSHSENQESSGANEKRDQASEGQKEQLGAKSMGEQRVGMASNISSDIKSGAVSVANKAMAIVQPTGNNTANLSSLSDLDKISDWTNDEPKALDIIKRSASDLSDSAQRLRVSRDKIGQAAGESERVQVLGQIFDGLASSGKLVDVKETEPSLVVEKGELPTSRLSTESLESIELPQKLVESIKSLDPKNPANAAAPSPNLLLGEVEVSAEPPNKSEASEERQPVVGQSEGETKAEVKTESDKPKSAVIQQPASKGRSKEVPDSSSKGKTGPLKQSKVQAANRRPANPMGRSMEAVAETTNAKEKDSSTSRAEIANHQIVVNKLDRRKTELEIVDIRDESLTGKMRASKDEERRDRLAKEDAGEQESGGWISMDGIAVVQPPAQPNGAAQLAAQTPSSQQPQGQPMSPGEIIESRFHVDYGSKRRMAKMESGGVNKDSMDSKTEERILNNIENELEQDNRMRNRKYFVYVVHDGHFTAKKECIARIELPPKRRITLAEVRQLISSSQDISLTSLRRNKFKFVTETYRLLNENEDAAVLHQVYPTQGVFLKLNIPEQESQVYPSKGRPRVASNSGALASSLSHPTIASRRRASARQPAGPSGRDNLPAIEVDYAQNEPHLAYGRTRASSVGRRPPGKPNAGAYRRSKSSVQGRARNGGRADELVGDKLPSIGRSSPRAAPVKRPHANQAPGLEAMQSLGSAATDLGANVLSGAKRLFNALR